MSGGWNGWRVMRRTQQLGEGVPRGPPVLYWHRSPAPGLQCPGVPQSPAQPMLPSSGHVCKQGLAVQTPTWDLQSGQGTVPHTAPQIPMP